MLWCAYVCWDCACVGCAQREICARARKWVKVGRETARMCVRVSVNGTGGMGGGLGEWGWGVDASHTQTFLLHHYRPGNGISPHA